MFRILDRYVIREMVIPFIISLVISTFVLEVPTILRQGEDLLAKGVDWKVIVRALVMLLPAALSITIPISLLLAILIAFGRLSADREFVAMQACGVSLMRLLRPVALVAVLATAATAYETIVALPDGNQTFREITYSVGASRVERSVKPGVFFEDFGNLIIYVNEVPQTGGWRRVFLADMRTPGKKTVHFAGEGRIRLDRVKQLVQLELKHVTSVTTYHTKPDDAEQSYLEEIAVNLDPKLVFKDPPARGDREMTLAELKENIVRARDAGDPREGHPGTPRSYPYRFMYHQKLAIPLTCPILALIGLALGASNRRDGKLASFVLGFIVILAFYILMFSFRALTMGGRVNPELGAWIPNLIMGVVALVLMVWRTRSADQPILVSLPVFWRTRAARETDSGRGRSQSGRRIVLVVRVPHIGLPRPRLLDLYVAREYWRVVLLAFLGLLGIFYITTFIDLADKLFRGSATGAMLLRYFYYQTPQYVFFVLPMSVLVATLVTIAVMTKNSELIIMRACGVSLYRTAVPLVLFGALVGGVLFLLQEHVLPAANRETDRLNRLIRGLPPQTSPFSQRWIIGRSGDFYHYDSFDVATNRFMNLWIYDVADRAWRLQGMIYSKEAVPTEGIPVDEQSLVPWQAQQGWERVFASSVKYEPFTNRALALEPPDYFASKPSNTDQMTFDEMLTYRELREYAEQLKASGADVIPYLVALQRKIAFPFVTVIMTLIAVPFAATTGRKGALYGIGVGIVLAISYFLTMSIFGALGTGGVLTPMLAGWAANLLFSAAALYLILTVRT
jgi:LPS export ABC transporter permease LptF/LPS export ABC transporter permease LptG